MKRRWVQPNRSLLTAVTVAVALLAACSADGSGSGTTSTARPDVESTTSSEPEPATTRTTTRPEPTTSKPATTRPEPTTTPSDTEGPDTEAAEAICADAIRAIDEVPKSGSSDAEFAAEEVAVSEILRRAADDLEPTGATETAAAVAAFARTRSALAAAYDSGSFDAVNSASQEVDRAGGDVRSAAAAEDVPTCATLGG